VYKRHGVGFTCAHLWRGLNTTSGHIIEVHIQSPILNTIRAGRSITLAVHTSCSPFAYSYSTQQGVGVVLFIVLDLLMLTWHYSSLFRGTVIFTSLWIYKAMASRHGDRCVV